MSAILLRSPAFRNRFTFAHPAGAPRSRSSHLWATYSETDAGPRLRRDENRHDVCDTRRVEPIKDQSAVFDAPES